jgi:hypothetical protein
VLRQTQEWKDQITGIGKQKLAGKPNWLKKTVNFSRTELGRESFQGKGDAQI